MEELKQFALKLLNEWNAAESALIWEFSADITQALADQDKEYCQRKLWLEGFNSKLCLVYQCGIANVFKGKERLLQQDFHSCEQYCRGAQAMGAIIEVYHCDKAGDISSMEWESGPGDMFGEAKTFKEILPDG